MEMLNATASEIEFALGKRQLNTLVGTIAGATAIELDYHRILQRQELTENLSTFRYMDVFEYSGQTNLLRPPTVEALIGKQARKGGYLSGIGFDGLHSLLGSVTDASSYGQAPLVFRMVYGATEQAPLRALSYPLPAMQAIERVRQRSNIAAYLQVVFASRLSAAINDLDEDKVARETSQLVAGISNIAEKRGLIEQVGFYDDAHVNEDAVQEAGKVFAGAASQEFKQVFVSKGSSEDIDRTSRYVGAHFVLQDCPDTRLRYVSGARISESARVIDMGGLQERYYRAARMYMQSALDLGPIAGQVYTRHHVPPYYMARGGDVALSDYLDGKTIDDTIASTAKADLLYLQNFVDVELLRQELQYV